MLLIGLLDVLVGIYLLIDTAERLRRSIEVLYFDSYLLGFAKYIPIALAILMLIAGLGIIIRKRTNYVLLSYISSFIFILFYTPTALFLGNGREDIRFLIYIELILLMISIIVLFTTYNKVTSSNAKSTRITYEDYRKSLLKFKEQKEEREERELEDF